MALSKVELRKTIRNLLSKKTKEEQEKQSLEISKHLIEFLKNENSKNYCLGGYSPIQEEPIWFSAMRDFPKLAFPRIEKEKMDFFLAPFSELKERGEYSIKEPDLHHQRVTPDVLLIPGIAFTKKGLRLGRGGGHYDRYLSGFKGMKIGICFELQIVDDVLAQPHDQKVDFVVTENGVIGNRSK